MIAQFLAAVGAEPLDPDTTPRGTGWPLLAVAGLVALAGLIYLTRRQ